MTDPRAPIPGTPEAEFRAWLAAREAESAFDRPPSPRMGEGWRWRVIAALAWLPLVALGWGVGRWMRWW